MEFAQLLGNEALKARLSQTKLFPAYIISGPEGSGRYTLAQELACAMVCSGDKPPCGNCIHCRKARRGIHPDIITIDRLPDKREITVEQIRTMRQDAFVLPNEAAAKVYILRHAGTMGPAAQNALLKLIEEPPPYGAFLLLTESPGDLLPTIRSRCVELAMTPLETEEVLQWLAQHYGRPADPEVQAAAAYAQGIIGQALAYMEGRAENQALAERYVALLEQGDQLGLLELAIGLEKTDRQTMGIFLYETKNLLLAALGKGKAAGQKRLYDAARLMDDLERSLDANVGMGHIIGRLAAEPFHV